MRLLALALVLALPSCSVLKSAVPGLGAAEALAKAATGGGAKAESEPEMTEATALEIVKGSVNNEFAIYAIDAVLKAAGAAPVRSGSSTTPSQQTSQPQSLIDTLKFWEGFNPDWSEGHLCYGLSERYMADLVADQSRKLGLGEPPYDMQQCDALVGAAIEVHYRIAARVCYGSDHDTLIHLRYWRGRAYCADYKRGGLAAVADALEADPKATPAERRETLAREIRSLD